MSQQRLEEQSSINIIVIEHPLDNPHLKPSELGNVLPPGDTGIPPPIRDASVSHEHEEDDPLFVVLCERTNQVAAEILRRSGNHPLDITISFPIVRIIPYTWIDFFSIVSTSSYC